MFCTLILHVGAHVINVRKPADQAHGASADFGWYPNCQALEPRSLLNFDQCLVFFWQFLALLGSIASNPSYNIAIFFFGIWAYNNRDSNAPIKTVGVCGIYTGTVLKSNYLPLTSSLLHWPLVSSSILCGLACTAITLLTREALDLPWREWPNFVLVLDGTS